MNVVKIILNFLLSALFVATPILGLSSESNLTSAYETSCCEEGCEMMKDNQRDCHTNSDHTKDDCKDKCQDSCYDHASHVVQLTIQSPIQNSTESVAFPCKDLKRTDYYQDLILQQLIFQFWNPPKSV